MDPAHVVLLIGVTITVVAIAGYLIAIALVLKRVVERLVVVLGAVDAVIETAEPVGAVIDDINRDLDVGRQLLESGVQRLADRMEPPDGPTAASERHAVAEPAPAGGGGAAATAAPPAGTETGPERPARGLGGLGGGWKR